jgi:hypothetical protein
MYGVFAASRDFPVRGRGWFTFIVWLDGVVFFGFGVEQCLVRKFTMGVYPFNSRVAVCIAGIFIPQGSTGSIKASCLTYAVVDSNKMVRRNSTLFQR